MKFLNFIWYCIQCMMGCFSATMGHGPDNFSGIDIAVGIITLLFFIGLFFFILWLIGYVSKKTKNKKNKSK